MVFRFDGLLMSEGAGTGIDGTRCRDEIDGTRLLLCAPRREVFDICLSKIFRYFGRVEAMLWRVVWDIRICVVGLGFGFYV